MAGAGWHIQVADAEVQTALNAVVAAGLDPEPLFEDIGQSLIVSTQHRFEAETDPQGRKWKALAKSTLRRKRGDNRILRQSNRLYDSITKDVAPDYLLVGTDVAYGGVHQGGATIDHYARSQKATFSRNRKGQLRFASKRSKAKSRVVKPITIGDHTVTIPARPYLGLDEADKAMILEKAGTYLTSAAQGGVS
jgi:phage virion morphogenesis protein